MESKKSKNTGRKKYIKPDFKKYNIKELSKGWDLEVIGKDASCTTMPSCG